MSGYLAGKVWQSGLEPELKPLAACLADVANDDGTSIWPSVAYMAWLMGRSERQIQTCMQKLREAGVLVVVSGGKGGRSKSTEYRMIEESLPKRERWKNHAESTWFKRPRKRPASGKTIRRPDAISSISTGPQSFPQAAARKPRSLRHENHAVCDVKTTQCTSPDTLVDPLVSPVSESRKTEKPTVQTAPAVENSETLKRRIAELAAGKTIAGPVLPGELRGGR